MENINISLAKHSFDYLKYSLVDFIDNFPGGAHIKESKNLTYLYSNMRNLEVYGLHSNTDIKGKTFADLANNMQDKIPDGFLKDIYSMDNLTVRNKSPTTAKNKMFLNNAGFVVIYTMMKIPLFDESKEVKSILTISFESTQNENVGFLCETYRGLYQDQTIANAKFLQYIGFNKFINKNLTTRELDCLIALSSTRSFKSAAIRLSVSVKTIETYCNRIIQKTDFTSLSKLIEKFIETRHNRRGFYAE